MPEGNFQREVLDRLTKIEVKLDDYTKIKEKVEENTSDIKLLKDAHENDKWLKRTMVSALIVAVVTVIFTFVKLGGF